MKQRLLVVLLYAALGVALLSPSASDFVVPSAPDTVPHLGTIVQARMALEEGQFPLRVAPWQHNGWGYPVWQFYSPLPYTVAGLLHWWVSPENPYVAYKLTLWLALSMGGVFTSLLAARLTGSRPAALLAGGMYVVAPYFLINVHARGALPEAVAQGILPAVLYVSLRCYASPRWRRVIVAGVAWAALALTHTITFVYGSLFVGLWFVLLVGRPRKSAPRLARLGAAYGLGWLLALYVLAPVVMADYVRARDNLVDPFTMNWYTPLAALLSPVSVAPEPQPGLQSLYVTGLHPAVGWPMLLGAGLVAYTLVAQPGTPRRRTARRHMLGLLAVFGVALFMTWSPVDFWSWLPTALHVTQFTYRLLTHVMWAGALLGAYALVILFKGQLDGRHVVAGLFLIGMASSSWLPTLKNGNVKLDALVRQPDMGYGGSDYLMRIDPTLGAASGAETELPAVYPDGWLILDRALELPRSLFAFSAPTFRIAGDVPPGVFKEEIRLSVLLNGRRVDSLKLGEGPFEWDVALTLPSDVAVGEVVKLTIVSDKTFRPRDLDPGTRDRRELAVRARSVAIGGSSVERTMAAVTVTEPLCRRTGLETACRLAAPPQGGRMQLPVLFYPGLMDVRIDGQAAPYVPLAYRSFVLVGVDVPPGQHDVTVRFRGLWWANWISGAAWLAAVGAIAASLVRVPRLGRRVLEARRASA